MIKLIQVITDTNVGGAGIWLLNYLKGYSKENIDLAVVLPKDAMLKERVENLGVRVIEADGIADVSLSLDGVKSLYKIFKEEAPDIIHTHASLSARISAKLLKIKVLNTRHCIEPKKSFLKRLVFGFLNNSLSDRVIAVSTAVYENLLDDGIKKSKLSMVYNGIEPLTPINEVKKRAVKYTYKIPEDKKVVGIVARLEDVKNHDMFLEGAKVILAIAPDTCFLVVGDGAKKQYLIKKAEELEISKNVIFTGYIEDVNDILNVIDICVLTSKSEALSISLLEAMSLGKPIVATDSGGPSEMIETGKNGILVGVDDLVNFTMAVLKLLKSPELCEEYGNAGKRILAEKFSLDKMIKDVEKIYFDLV